MNYTKNIMSKPLALVTALMLVFSISFPAGIAWAATGGPNSGSNFTSVSFPGPGGSDVVWSNPSNTQSSDDSYATALIDDNDESEYLKATGFGFSIPVNSVIDGIEVSVEKSALQAGEISDYRVRLVKDGVTGSTDRADTSTEWGTSDITTTYGNSTDLWGTTWSVLDVNSAATGVVFAAGHDNGGGPDTARVDHITMTVYYTSPTPLPFTETFGTSNSTTVSGWVEHEPTIITGSTSGPDITQDGTSSNKFAKIGEDNGGHGYICRYFDAIGKSNLLLSYAWNGDHDAESNDYGVVEYKTSGNCSDSSGWTNVASYVLDQPSHDEWQSQSGVSLSVDNSIFLLRFRNVANGPENNEYFRVDDVIIQSASVGSISGQKYNDVDGDGIKDLEEVGLPGWTINLSGTTNNSTVTDQSGNYSFLGLGDGTYNVCEILQAGWQQIFPSSPQFCPGPSAGYSISIGGGNDAIGNNFGNRQMGKIVIEKQTNPTSQEVFDFTASYDIDGFSLTDDQSNDSGFIPAGTYSVNENNVPVGWDLTSATCNDGSLVSAIDVSPGETVTCTFVNTKRGSITVFKDVRTPDHQSLIGDNHPFTVNLNGSDPQVITDSVSYVYNNLVPETYTITENPDPKGNYDFFSFSSDEDLNPSNGAQITIAPGQAMTLTIENAQKQGQLTVFKQVIWHGIGTEAFPSDFTMNVDGINVLPSSSFPGSEQGTPVTLDPGEYSVSEDGLEGYAMSQSSDCLGTMTSNGNKTCNVTNSDIPIGQGAITVIKYVNNDNGGKFEADSFTLRISSLEGSVTSGQANFVAPGNYTVSEDNPSQLGYNNTGISCVSGQTTDTDGQITVAEQQAWVCTITNDDKPVSLTLNKVVTNDNGGTATGSDWTLTASGQEGRLSGQGPTVSDKNFSAGTYTLSESDGPEGYTESNWICEGGSLIEDQLTLNLGESATCTITNDDIPPLLTLIKEVNNQEGGEANPWDWTLTATGPTTISGSGNEGEYEYSVQSGPEFSAGDYTLSESGQLENYFDSEWNCEGAENEGDSLTLLPGQEAVCTITNTYHPIPPPKLTVTKVVVNDDGRTNTDADFNLFVGQTQVVSGEQNNFEPGEYAVTENQDANYTAAFTGDCDQNGNIALEPGEEKTCTITNDDIAQQQQQQQGGGGGGGGGGYVQPELSISNESSGEPTDVSVTIGWNTSYAATSQVIYAKEGESHTLDLNDNSGTPPKYGYARTTPEYDVSPPTVTHFVTVTGLDPNTVYYFRTVSHGSLVFGGEHTFTTKEAGQGGLVLLTPTGGATPTGGGVTGGGTTAPTGGEAGGAPAPETIPAGPEVTVTGGETIPLTAAVGTVLPAPPPAASLLLANILSLGSDSNWVSWLVLLLILLLIYGIWQTIRSWSKKKNKGNIQG